MARVTKAKKTKIVNKLLGGMSVVVAAREFGISDKTLYAWKYAALALNTATTTSTTANVTQFLTAHNTFLQNYITQTLNR